MSPKKTNDSMEQARNAQKKNLQIPGRRAGGGKAEAAAVHCSVLVVLIVGTTIETNSLYSIMYIEFVFCTY